MGADIEWLAGVMRLGPNLHKYGDPYELLCGVVRFGNTIIFIGASHQAVVNVIRERAAIRKLLKPLGIVWVSWSRLRNGVEVWRKYQV
jgi:hypothetical protein